MAFGSPQWMYASGEAYELEQGLKFEDGNEPKLTFTPSTAGNRKKITVSVWAKRGTLGTAQYILSSGGRFDTAVVFDSTDNIQVFTNYAEVWRGIETIAVFRDTSAWLHIVATWDTNNATSTDRHILWVNGVRQAVTNEVAMPQNGSTELMNTTEHTIGTGGRYQNQNQFDGYLAEMHVIDGQVLTPADFGETGDYGEWKPVEYSGTYGNNGFYLPFKQDYTVEGFSTVTYKGTAANHYIGGVGFSPDLVWTKCRSTAGKQHILVDAIRGGDKNLMSDSTEAENSAANRKLTLGAADGYVIDSNSGHLNESDKTYVSWNWDMGLPSTGVPVSLTANGDAQHSTAQNKIGASSIAFDGTGDYINVADNEKWELGTKDFTIEMWAKIATNSSDYSGLFTMGSPQVSFRINSQGRIQFLQDHGGTRGMISDHDTTGTNLRDNAWHHLAVVREGTDWNLYVDGTSEYSGTGMSGNISSIETVYIGRRVDSGSHYLTGYLDEVRVSNNARYTSNFTAPTTAFTNDSNTIFLLHSDTSNGSTTFTDSSGATKNTDGSITSYVKANTTYGQSTVSYTGNATSGATVGHGLSSAPEVIILKNRESNTDWNVFHTSIGATKFLRLNSNVAEGTNSAIWNDTAPTNSVFSLGNNADPNSNNEDYIAYCFHSVTGYSKFGSFDGTGSATAINVNCGFEPAFLLWKVADASSGRDWYIIDNVRTTDRTEVKNYLTANTSNAEVISTSNNIAFTSTGFTVTSTNDEVNSSGDKTIYMAFADTREYAYWLDQSGNNNDWTSNNLTESDISVDSPTNNFCTWNPLQNNAGATLSEGNLKCSIPGNSRYLAGTFSVSSGKWYCEITMLAGGSTSFTFAVAPSTLAHNDTSDIFTGSVGDNLVGAYDVDVYTNGSATSNYFGSSIQQVGAVLGIALDLDSSTQTVKFALNNSWGSAITLPVQGEHWKLFAGIGSSSGPANSVLNAGQDSSFAGNKTAQGNQDGNSIGDFYYTPPTGFLALCTKNLPDVAVVPSEHFNTVLYTGNGVSGRGITGVGFQPDFLWVKARSAAYSNRVTDALIGATNSLITNSTGAIATDDVFDSFDSDGFTVGNDAGSNANTKTYVAWNWKANGSGSSNTNGSITSTVSANVDAGFSIISYTGNGSNNQTLGHGLSKAPEIGIFKERGGSASWEVETSNITGTIGDLLYLNLANAKDSATTDFSAKPTSSVFQIGGSNVNENNMAMICYAFHSVDGYSKVGKLHGNSSTDGTFVYTGFKPKMVMWKNTEASANWFIMDSERNEGGNAGNPIRSYLHPNSSAAENWVGTSGILDFTSNGFKYRASNNSSYNFDYDYIFIAFAETPFKYSNAR